MKGARRRHGYPLAGLGCRGVGPGRPLRARPHARLRQGDDCRRSRRCVLQDRHRAAQRLKILLQTRTNEFRSLGLLKSLNKLRKHDGVLGFYKGNGASVLRIVPYAALHYMAYERYRCWILGNCPTLGTGPVVDLLAGSASGGTAVLCTYPLDLARTKLAFQASCTPYSFIEPSLLFGPKMLTATSLRSPMHQHPAVPSPGLCHLKGRGGAMDASD